MFMSVATYLIYYNIQVKIILKVASPNPCVKDKNINKVGITARTEGNTRYFQPRPILIILGTRYAPSMNRI